jgi:hypothetical protein
MVEQHRFTILKRHEGVFNSTNKDLKFKLRKLMNIEDPDEQHESLHTIRQTITQLMLEEANGLRQLANTARSSSTRAYAGHSSEMRHIFDIKKMNLTEFARSFGLYKQLYLVG